MEHSSVTLVCPRLSSESTRGLALHYNPREEVMLDTLLQRVWSVVQAKTFSWFIRVIH